MSEDNCALASFDPDDEVSHVVESVENAYLNDVVLKCLSGAPTLIKWDESIVWKVSLPRFDEFGKIVAPVFIPVRRIRSR